VTITFNVGAGSLLPGVPHTRQVAVGTRVTNFPVPTPPAGYAFTGWFLGGNLTTDFTATTNVTLYARYQRTAVRNYTLTFVLNNGQMPAGTAATQVHAYGTVINTFPTPTRAGHVFAGWMLDNRITSPPLTIRGNTTLSAVWTPATTPTPTPAPGHLVAVFDPSPGAFTGTETGIRSGAYGFVVSSMPNPTRTGYTFAGWNVGGSRITLPLTVRRDMTINATWTPNIPGRPNPQTSPLQITFAIFGAVMLVGLASFGIMKITGKQLAAQGQYRTKLTRYNREERIVDMLNGDDPKKKK